MHILNESFEDKIMRLRYEMLIMHSKTGQSLGLDKAEDFDAALSEALRPETLRTDDLPKADARYSDVPSRQISTGRGTMMSDIDGLLSERARKMYKNTSVIYEPVPIAERDTVLSGSIQTCWRNDFPAGRDTLIAEAAQKYAQAMDVSGKHDTVFAAPA